MQFTDTYEHIISLENLLGAWQEFARGKRHKKGVAEFALHLTQNITVLHEDLKNKTYQHGTYVAFAINDPKPRTIHKATVRDRLLHHAIHRALYPFFDRVFIADSYSCRVLKGTHKAIARFRAFARGASKNNTKTLWVLKCDIKKFFASVDQDVLLAIVEKCIPDNNIMWLLERIVWSFKSTLPGKGLPLGNLTSQLLVNIYMNELDQFVKHELKARYYIRYADDFVIMSQDKKVLLQLLPKVETFLSKRLSLSLHPDKVNIQTLASGVDFLGWVHFSDHRVLRTATKQKMFRNITAKNGKTEIIQSYLGLLCHGNAKKLERRVERMSHRDF